MPCAPEHNTHPKVIELEIYPSNVEATLPQRIWSVKWLLEVGSSCSEVCSGVELSRVMPIVSDGYIASLESRFSHISYEFFIYLLRKDVLLAKRIFNVPHGRLPATLSGLAPNNRRASHNIIILLQGNKATARQFNHVYLQGLVLNRIGSRNWLCRPSTSCIISRAG
jgi:hypothetical protein